MLLPGALPDTLLLIRALWLLPCPRLLLVALDLLPPVLSLLLVMLVLLLLPLRGLLVVTLGLLLPVLRSLLVMLGLLLVPVLGPLLAMLVLLLLLTTLFRPALLMSALLRMILFLALLLVLCVSRSGDSEKQGENGCAGDSNYFHLCYPRSDRVRMVSLYCKRPVCGFTGLPIASSDTRSSTLRFCWRPAALSFEATANVLPKPLAVTEFAATPCCTR